MAKGEDAMIRRMRSFFIYTLSTSKDSYGEQVKSFTKGSAIDVALSLVTGTTSNNNNILTSSSTHVGITDSTGVKQGCKLADGTESYIVDYVVDDGRKTLLYLQKESTYGV